MRNREPEHRDMFGIPIDVGDIIEFIGNDSFHDNGCDAYFLNKKWVIESFNFDTLFVKDGHLPNSTYNYYFPLDCVRLILDYGDIDLSDVCDVSSLFGN